MMKTSQGSFFAKRSTLFVAALCVFFVTLVYPLIQDRTSKENVAERQAQNAGMIRMYCRYDGFNPIMSPNIPFGKHPFNVEFSFSNGHKAALVALSMGHSAIRLKWLAVLLAWFFQPSLF